ncbi:MAG: GNAT family N-acetyltransferase [Myxococcota bacterium]|nr:GNAT family N-acetyltransferase [Myxococcota bacterium]
MERSTREEVERHAVAYDAAVEADPQIDPFCSRSDWQLAYHDAFAPQRPLWMSRADRGFVVLAESDRFGGRTLLEPLENMWGLGSPLVGEGAGEALGLALREAPSAVLLLGLPLSRPRLDALLRPLEGRFAARPLQATVRYVASLQDGLDGWLGRRTPAFRRNLRAARRRVVAAGIAFRRATLSSAEELEECYARVLALEARSWKARSGAGVHEGWIRDFYANLWRRLAGRGQLRVLFAEREGEALGYLHGALVGARFRGLQFSFDDAERSLGLGNALQMEMIEWLCENGARSYDLGGDSSYKERWAEMGLETFGLLLRPLQG